MFIKGITIEICMWDWFNGTEAKRNGYMVLIIGFIFVNKLKMDSIQRRSMYRILNID